MKIPRRKAIKEIVLSALAIAAAGPAIMGCGSSGGGGGGGVAPVNSNVTPSVSKTVLASLHDHIGGGHLVEYEFATQDGDKIKKIKSAQGGATLLEGTSIVFTVNGAQASSTNPGEKKGPQNEKFTPERFIVKTGDVVRWYDLNAPAGAEVKYTI